MSLELCSLACGEVSKVIADKLRDPALAVSVGGSAIDHIVAVEYQNSSARIKVSCVRGDSARLTFDYPASGDSFSQTAIDQNGEPICIDCD